MIFLVLNQEAGMLPPTLARGINVQTVAIRKHKSIRDQSILVFPSFARLSFVNHDEIEIGNLENVVDDFLKDGNNGSLR